MKETNEIEDSSITTISALVIMSVITLVGAWLMFSSEPQIHDNPLVDVIQNMGVFDLMTIVILIVLKEILLKVGVVVMLAILILALFATLLSPLFPFLIVSLPFLGLVGLIVLFILLQLPTSNVVQEFFSELTSWIEPTIDKAFKKCFVILIVVNICEAPIMYHTFCNY